jgi:hypothetical protein
VPDSARYPSARFTASIGALTTWLDVSTHDRPCRSSSSIAATFSALARPRPRCAGSTPVNEFQAPSGSTGMTVATPVHSPPRLATSHSGGGRRCRIRTR